MTQKLEEKLRQGLDDKIFSGAQFIVGKDDEILFEYNCGKTSFLSDASPVSEKTFFDVASLTKPIVTTTAILLLLQDKKFKLDTPVVRVFPDFVLDEDRGGSPREKITIRHLLKHMSGLPAWKPYFEEMEQNRPQMLGTPEGKDWYLSRISQESLICPPAYRRLYGDLGFIALGGIVEHVSGTSLDDFFQNRIAEPLGLKESLFLPNGGNLKIDVAACAESKWRGKVIIGEVDDDNAYAMGGVAGHAGLFQTARDCHSFAVIIKNALRGSVDLFSQDLLDDFIGPKNKVKAGWDRPEFEGSQAGSKFSNYSIGHLGFTGTSFWIDIENSFQMILFTNRVHPSRDNEKLKQFRPELHDLAYDSLLLSA